MTEAGVARIKAFSCVVYGGKEMGQSLASFCRGSETVNKRGEKLGAPHPERATIRKKRKNLSQKSLSSTVTAGGTVQRGFRGADRTTARPKRTKETFLSRHGIKASGHLEKEKMTARMEIARENSSREAKAIRAPVYL